MAEVGTPRHRFFGRKGKKWCVFEDVFYAFSTEAPATANEYEKANFSYFIVTTKIGVGGEDEIKKIFFRLRFDPLKGYPAVEIISIAPTDETRNVGIITDTEKEWLSRGGGLKGMADAGLDIAPVKAKLEISGEVGKGKKFERSAESSYPREILITRSSGVSNTATWEFKQGNAAPIKGEYDLKVAFRIRMRLDDIRSDENQASYSVTPTIQINDEDLLENGNPITPRPLFVIRNV